jgi:hypothetical protein
MPFDWPGDGPVEDLGLLARLGAVSYARAISGDGMIVWLPASMVQAQPAEA